MWCGSIGRYCSIAGGLRIGDHNHPTDWLSTNVFQYNVERFLYSPQADSFARIPEDECNSFLGTSAVVGNEVWIGSRVTITRGVTIGDGAVVAFSAVVTKEVAPYSVVAGVQRASLANDSTTDDRRVARSSMVEGFAQPAGRRTVQLHPRGHHRGASPHRRWVGPYEPRS